MKNKNNFKLSIFGLVIGVLNGLFGAGGGIAAVEFLKHFSLDQKRAQTTSIAIVLPLCTLSALLYSRHQQIDFKTMLILIFSGIVGAALGTILMKKVSLSTLKKIFCGFLIYAGVRMIFGG